MDIKDFFFGKNHCAGKKNSLVPTGELSAKLSVVCSDSYYFFSLSFNLSVPKGGGGRGGEKGQNFPPYLRDALSLLLLLFFFALYPHRLLSLPGLNFRQRIILKGEARLKER